ncbi:MAG: carbon-nitrogen hydrolase family protein [Thermoplasmata archaeon]|nr:MAG: carbon-nitrogen hydrolase family protein [Thermoplasmata archaeon]
MNLFLAMKVCVVSASPKVGNKKRNIKKMKKYIDKEEADLYIFGEMFLTGYVCREEIFSLAEDGEGDSIREIKEIAEQRNCSIVFGMPFEERKGMVYNSAVLARPKSIGIYKKNFLANFGPFEEKFFFSPGNDMPVFKVKNFNIGMCICYDIFFPELIKGLVLKGADLIVCISASPSITKIYFERVLPARATENTAFVVYSNLVGEEEGLSFWGGSQAYTPRGELIDKAEYFKEDYIVCNIDEEELKEARIARPTLRDTKADLFLDLYSIAKNKDVFNENVKIGIRIGEKIKGKVNEIDVYGNEDVAFGIKLSTGCNKINVIPSKEIKVIVDGKEMGAES